MGRRGPKIVIRPVVQYTMDGEFVARYESLSDAARAINLNVQNVAAATQSRTVSAGGYIWAYDDEEALLKVKINDLLKIVDNQGKATFTLNNIYELEVLQARIRRRKATKMKTRLLDDGRIWVHLSKGPKEMKRLPAERKSNKPKWWLCYQVNGLDYLYALDFGRGDTEEEAIKDFHQSRIDSDLNHKVVYVDRDYYKVLEYLLEYGGGNLERAVQTQTMLVERSI